MPGHPLVETSEPKPTKIGILLRVALFILIGYMGMLVFSLVMEVLLPENALVVKAALAPFASAAIANAIVVRVYERGRLADLGLAWTATSLREFLLGGGLAAGAATLILITPLVAGIARFEPAPAVEHRWASIFFIAIVLLFGAAGEEMLFHGYAFQLLIRSMGAFATILPAAVLFGLAHLGNENANLMGVLNTMLWGVLLGYAYVRTRALWLPIGLHYGWNLALPLFGVNLSGFTMGITGYALHWRVGDLWSGGGYGPEGGLPATMIVIVLFFAVAKAFPDFDPREGPHASREIGDPDAVK
jgi:membrane protease YdiL (CAAX protease family)